MQSTSSRKKIGFWDLKGHVEQLCWYSLVSPHRGVEKVAKMTSLWLLTALEYLNTHCTWNWTKWEFSVLCHIMLTLITQPSAEFLFCFVFFPAYSILITSSCLLPDACAPGLSDSCHIFSHISSSRLPLGYYDHLIASCFYLCPQQSFLQTTKEILKTCVTSGHLPIGNTLMASCCI